MFKLDLEKVEPEIKLPASIGLKKMQENFRKKKKNYINFCIIDYAKAFDCVYHNNCGKFLKRWEYHSILTASWESCMQVQK